MIEEVTQFSARFFCVQRQVVDLTGVVMVAGIVVLIVWLATSSGSRVRACPNCREINRFHAIYCAQCGRRLRET